MNWTNLKKELYKLNRVSELYNKGTKQEIMVLWNGTVVCMFDGNKKFEKVFQESDKPIGIVRKVLVLPPKNRYDYGTYKDELVGYTLPPDSKNSSSRKIMMSPGRK